MDSKSNKNLTGVVGAIGAVGTLVTAVTPLVEKAIDNAQNNSGEKEPNKVAIPELYKKGFPIDLEQAEKLLIDCGLKTIKSELKIKDANPKYANCFDMQVLNSSPKQGTMVKLGSTVCLQYITQSVIDESQKIIEDTKRAMVEAKDKKLAEKNERREHTKETVKNMTDKAVGGVKKIFARTGKDK